MKALFVVALLAIWPMSSSKEYHMTADSSVPAASGTVKVQKDKNNNNNRKLDIKVNNLANPASLTPPENAYIVWVRPSDGEAVKEGSLGVGKNLGGELKVVTTSRNFDVFITAEQSESVTTPTGVEVLRTHVNP